MAEWPLVGRTAEADLARRVVLAGPAGAVVLAGPAGVGKSRLADQVLTDAARDGRTVLRAVASRSAATVPFGALAPLLPPAAGERDPLALLQTVRAHLAAQAGGRPVLLGVDDAHLLDPGSATLVHQLVTERGCGLVATVRSGAVAPDAVLRLWRDDGATRIDLAPLGPPQVHAALESVLGPPVTSGTAYELWRRSQGNPLFLHELVRAAREDGRLARDSGAWTLRAGDASSPRLEELVRSRLGALGPADLAAVELLALADQVSVDALEHLAPGVAVEALEERGVIVVGEEGRRTSVRLSHPVYGEVLRAGLPVTRRRRWHRTLAAWVADRGARRREDVLRTASWLLDSDRRPDAGLLTAAARQAVERFDLPLAERLAQAAVDAGGGVPARVALGDATWRQGRVEHAVAVLAEAAALARTEEEIADVADSRAYVLDLAGRSVEAWAVLTEAGELVGPRRRDLLDSQAAILSVLAGRPGPALAAARRVLDPPAAGTPVPAPLVRMRADYAVTFALALQGDFDAAAASAERSAAFIAGLPQPHPPPELALLGRVVAHVLAGWLAAAAVDAERVEAAALALGDRDAEWTSALYRARVALATGQVAAALPFVERAVAATRDLGDAAGLRWSLGAQAMALALLGRAEQAGAVGADIDRLPPRDGGLFEVDLTRRGRAWTEVAAGRYDDARRRLAQAADLAADLGQSAVELLVRHDLLRLGDRAQGPRLADLAADRPGPYPDAVGRQVAAQRTGDPQGLAAAAEAFAECGYRIEAAEAAAEAVRAARRTGQSRVVTALARRAAQLTADCADVRTPGLLPDLPAPAALTAREREIAELAARRLSAAEIADRLVLSRRTVENHLQRVYAKLGVTSRSELAEALAR